MQDAGLKLDHEPLLVREKPAVIQRTEYGRTDELQDLRDQRDSLQRKLKDRHYEDRGLIAKQLVKTEKALDTRTPPDLNGAERDRLLQRETTLANSIREGMPSNQEMRRRPSGSDGKHAVWNKKKKLVLEWKQVRLLLNKGSDDPDVANVEILRPNQSTLGMDDATVGSPTMISFPSPEYQSNYDSIDWGGPAEKAQLLKEIAALKDAANMKGKSGEATKGSKVSNSPAKAATRAAIVVAPVKSKGANQDPDED